MFVKLYSLLNGRSIKINYILNLIRVLSGALVGIFTMPYINRVLGAVSLGKVEYVNSIITYFILFSALGIPMYGIREVARVRADKKEVAKVTAELLLILFITTFLAFLILYGVIYQLDYFANYRDILIVLSAMIFLMNIGAEWYFQGLENQLYITVRYVIVRIIMVCIMFIFINDSTDYIFYAVCIVITTCGANVLNFFYIYKMIARQDISYRELNLQRHIRPVFTIFVAAVSVNIYLQLDYFLIGSISGDKYVGYYSVANKLVRFVISFITIIGAVMLPRLSYLFTHDRVQYEILLKRSFTYFIALSLPCSIYFLVFAEPIILLMGGADFESSILTMRIIAPLCIIVSMAYFMGFLIIYPQNKEKIYTYATLISAVFSIIANLYAIRNYQHNGAAVIAVFAELIAILIMFVTLKRMKLLPVLFDSNLLKIVVVSVAMLLISLIISFGTTLNLFVASIVIWGIYLIGLLVLKEREISELYHRLIKTR